MHNIRKIPGFRSGSLRNMVIASAFYMLALIGVCGGLADAMRAVSGATPPPTPATQAAAAPAATPPPTTAPEPTATPTPVPEPTPTPVPEPTPTPRPQPTPTPTPNRSAERAYINEVLAINTVVGDALSRMSELLRNPRPGNDTWTVQMATQLAAIRAAYGEALRLSPPASFAAVHATWIEGLELLDESTYLLANGIDTRDVALLERATDKVLAANDKIREATALLGQH